VFQGELGAHAILTEMMTTGHGFMPLVTIVGFHHARYVLSIHHEPRRILTSSPEVQRLRIGSGWMKAPIPPSTMSGLCSPLWHSVMEPTREFPSTHPVMAGRGGMANGRKTVPPKTSPTLRSVIRRRNPAQRRPSSASRARVSSMPRRCTTARPTLPAARYRRPSWS
jgi:hypothetical protein